MSETREAYRLLRSPVTWYGGKGAMARAIVDLLPPHETYVEPFCGGASVLFAKPPSPLDVLNDKHEGITTLYRVLRDPTQRDRFIELCQLTEYSRALWAEAVATWATEADSTRKAWLFFIASRGSFTGHPGRTGWRYSVQPDGHAVLKWLSAVDRLPEIHARLRTVQIDNRDWRDVLSVYDRPATCWYVDPPYMLETRTGGRYDYEMSLEDHAELVERLLALDGLVVLSGYQHSIYAPLGAAGWERREIEQVCWSGNTASGTRERRTECVWRNPAAVVAWERARGPLFSAVEVAQ